MGSTGMLMIVAIGAVVLSVCLAIAGIGVYYFMQGDGDKPFGTGAEGGDEGPETNTPYDIGTNPELLDLTQVAPSCKANEQACLSYIQSKVDAAMDFDTSKYEGCGGCEQRVGMMSGPNYAVDKKSNGQWCGRIIATGSANSDEQKTERKKWLHVANANCAHNDKVFIKGRITESSTRDGCRAAIRRYMGLGRSKWKGGNEGSVEGADIFQDFGQIDDIRKNCNGCGYKGGSLSGWGWWNGDNVGFRKYRLSDGGEVTDDTKHAKFDEDEDWNWWANWFTEEMPEVCTPEATVAASGGKKALAAPRKPTPAKPQLRKPAAAAGGMRAGGTPKKAVAVKQPAASAKKTRTVSAATRPIAPAAKQKSTKR